MLESHFIKRKAFFAFFLLSVHLVYGQTVATRVVAKPSEDNPKYTHYYVYSDPNAPIGPNPPAIGMINPTIQTGDRLPSLNPPDATTTSANPGSSDVFMGPYVPPAPTNSLSFPASFTSITSPTPGSDVWLKGPSNDEVSIAKNGQHIVTAGGMTGYYSSDGGQNWSQLNNNLNDPRCCFSDGSIFASPNNPLIFYAVSLYTERGPTGETILLGVMIRESDDGGVT